MKTNFKTIGILVMILLAACVLCFSGCKGSESREKVDDTVETLSGKRQVEQMDKMKKDFQRAQEKAAERMREQLEEGNE